MRATLTLIAMLAIGCGGGGGGSQGSGSDGGGGTGGGGGGGNATPCTITISGPVTTGTYHQCLIEAGPKGGNQIEVAAISLPGCAECEAIWLFSKAPTDSCALGGTEMQLIDPTQWPTALLMEADSDNSQASCTITTSQLDLANGHWSGDVSAFLFATDANFMTVGVASVTLTGGF